MFSKIIKFISKLGILTILCYNFCSQGFAQPAVSKYDLFRVDRAKAYKIDPIIIDASAYDRWAGYYRTEFDIPQETIWRAVADIGEQGYLYINGKKVDFRPDVLRQYMRSSSIVTRSVDLEPYLIPGQKNVIAIYFDGIDRDLWPVSFFQGKITLASGEQILLDMSPDNSQLSWKALGSEVNGWTQLGFDDSSWDDVETNTINSPINTFYSMEHWPGYDGRLVFENPNLREDKLYYENNRSIIVNVLTPNGLNGTLYWKLYKVNEDASYTALGNGSISDYTTIGHSNIYAIDLGTKNHGVYTLEVWMQNNETIIESRFPEPLIVYREIPMTEVLADSLEHGLNYELEAEIDFTTDTSWVEVKILTDSTREIVTEPTIVDTCGLHYRETPVSRYPGSIFSYQFNGFEHPGDWYLLELEYPDDARRKIGLSITRTEDYENYRVIDFSRTESGISIATGIKFPLSGKMKKIRWLHRADPGSHLIDIFALTAFTSGAAKRIRIYHINNELLPALKINPEKSRRLGIYTERARHIGINFGIKDPHIYGTTYDYHNYDMLQARTQRLLWQLDVSEHYTEYMRFMGQNIHIMNVYQYNDINTPYIVPDKIFTARIDIDIRDVSLRVFDANNIDVYSNLEYNQHVGMARDIETGIKGIESTEYAPISKDQTIAPAQRPIFKQLRMTHPDVQKAFYHTIDEIAWKFAISPAWKGIYNWILPGFTNPSFYSPMDKLYRNPPYPDPLDYDYADDVIEAFENDNPSINVPGRDENPNRYLERYNFLTDESMRDKWINWRCEYIRNLTLQMLDTLHKYRNDLEIIQGYYIDIPVIHRWLLDGKKSYHEHIKEYSLDPVSFAKDEHIWVSRYMYPLERNMHEFVNINPNNPLPDKSYVAAWEHHVNSEVISVYDQNGDKRAVTLHETWTESYEYYTGLENKEIKNMGKDPTKFPYGNRGRTLGKYTDRFSQENFVQALMGSDPNMLIHGFTDVGIIVVHGHELREYTKIFTSLPSEKFQPVLNSSFTSNLHIRELQKDGTYWFYVINPGYWTANATLELENINDITNVLTEETISVPDQGLKITLEPYEICAFKSETTNGTVKSYEIAPLPDSVLNHMRSLISIAKYTYPQTRDEFIESNANYLTGIDMLPDNNDTIPKMAEEAEQEIINGNYAKAWSIVTNWRFFQLIYDGILAEAKVAAGFTDKQSGPLTVEMDASISNASYWNTNHSITSYNWKFDDNTTDSGMYINHTFSAPGDYLVWLTAKDDEGNENTIQRRISVCDENFVDLNHDGTVDSLDMGIFSNYFGSVLNDPNWDGKTDFDGNGEIDIRDMVYLARRYGLACEGLDLFVPDGQVAHWSFDKTLSETKNGLDGNFMNGTANYTEGIIDSALQFDGVDDYIKIPPDYTNKFSVNGQMTFSAWINFDYDGNNSCTGGSPRHPVIQYTDDKTGFLIHIYCSNSISFHVTDSIGSNYLFINKNSRDNEWQQFTAVYQLIDGERRLAFYINGEEIESSFRTASDLSLNQGLNIGSAFGVWTPNEYFKGKMDEVRIFNRALREDEVLKLYYYGR